MVDSSQSMGLKQNGWASRVGSLASRSDASFNLRRRGTYFDPFGRDRVADFDTKFDGPWSAEFSQKNCSKLKWFCSFHIRFEGVSVRRYTS